MPRSYSFDHFTAVKPDPSKIGTSNDSQHPVKSETPLPEQEGLHYGRQHAQTVARAQARRMERETEQRLNEETAMMDETPPVEDAKAAVEEEGVEEAVEATPPAAKRRPRKPAPAAQRTGVKKGEHHTSVARRSTSKPGAASPQKTAKAAPKRKATRGTKEIASTKAVARTSRKAKKPTARAKTARSPARRTPKRR